MLRKKKNPSSLKEQNNFYLNIVLICNNSLKIYAKNRTPRFQAEKQQTETKQGLSVKRGVTRRAILNIQEAKRKTRLLGKLIKKKGGRIREKVTH